jgi:hypothetical protein
MSARLRRLACALPLLVLTVVPASAQSTRDEWLALRARKQARHHRLPGPATQPNALTITVVRVFADPNGYLVGVGEARNDTGLDLSYSRINFTFRDASGAEVGREWTYLHGGVNARIVANSAYETLLVPGAIGFFKVWTTIPASAMSSYTSVTSGENLPYEKPRAAYGERLTEWSAGPGIGRPEEWVPWVFGGLRRPIQQRATGVVFNDDPFGFLGDPKGAIPDVFTHSIQLSVAAYQDGVISDVQSTTAVAPVASDPCRGEPVTGMGADVQAELTIDFARPVNSIGRQSIEWHEVLVSQQHFEIPGAGGQRTFGVTRECGWTARSDVPWISISGGAESGARGGAVTFTVAPHRGANVRRGAIIVSGVVIPVVQGMDCNLVPPTTIFIGPGRVVQTAFAAPHGCLLGATSDSSWLRLGMSSPLTPVEGLALFADFNFSGATRRALVRIGDVSFVVEQGVARTADFNQDGQLDLLWHHKDGWVATWRMRGLQIVDGTLLAPPHMDPNWTPVSAADTDGDGNTDVVWQNATNGSAITWQMLGTSLSQLSGPRNLGAGTDGTWKVRSAADFNFDGFPDLVWNKQDTGSIFVQFTSNRPGGEPSFSQYPIQPLGPGAVADLNWTIVASGDFNRDGWQDVVWQHQTDGRIAVWKMQQTAVLETTLLSPGHVADLSWKIRAVGDMNGDDMPDLIWQHRVDGRVAVWVMNGTTMTTGVVIAQVADTGWEIVGPR